MCEEQAQDDFDDFVVEYAASQDYAGCGCLGCAPLSIISLLVVVVVAILTLKAW